MTEEKTIQTIHAPEGVIFQIPIGPFQWVLLPISDAALEALWKEREARKRLPVVD